MYAEKKFKIHFADIIQGEKSDFVADTVRLVQQFLGRDEI